VSLAPSGASPARAHKPPAQTDKLPLQCSPRLPLVWKDFVHRLAFILWVLLGSLCAASHAQSYDRVASIGESPGSAEEGDNGVRGMLVELVHALDRATHSSTRIVLRPFARSLLETAAGKADFHLPLIQNGNSPAPEGLAYVTEVDFGQIPFVIYSRKADPVNAKTVGSNRIVITEAGHEAFFPFPVSESNCLSCSLDMILANRADALVVPAEVADPLLTNPNYKGIHRALYAYFPVRALVPAKADSSATRRYLIDGVRQLKKTGELWKITGHKKIYSNWQP
jgi:hypothetical protein